MLQCNHNLCWKRQASWHELYPAQVLCCWKLSPLFQVMKQQQPQCVKLDLYYLRKWHKAEQNGHRLLCVVQICTSLPELLQALGGKSELAELGQCRAGGGTVKMGRKEEGVILEKGESGWRTFLGMGEERDVG